MLIYVTDSKFFIILVTLLIIILISFLCILYLLVSRKSFYKKIVTAYKMQLSEIHEQTNDALSEFELEYESMLKQAASSTNIELKENIKETFYLKDKIQKLDSLLSNINDKLEKNYAFLNDEIKKRDAILERKTKQIKRLKENR